MSFSESTVVWDDLTDLTPVSLGEMLVAVAPRWLASGLSPSLLAPDEVDRLERYCFVADRERFLAAHALKRRLLGKLLNREPARLRFERDWAGKPYLEGQRIHFNLAHSGDWVALAFSSTESVGIDVEHDGSAVYEELESVVLHPRDQFSPTPTSAEDRFYTAWTLKEAISKGIGLGIRLAFSGLRLEPTEAGRYQCLNNGKRWYASHRRLENGAHLTVACPIPWTKLRLLRVHNSEPYVGSHIST